MHDLDQCFEFKERSLSQRKDFLKIKGMCYGCYNRGHIAKFCKQRKLCQIHVCNSTALHDPHWKPPNKPDKEKETKHPVRAGPENNPPENQVNSRATVCDITEAGDAPVNMGIVPVWLYDKNNPNEKVAVYALLDNASCGTFIKQETLRKLGMTGSNFKLRLTFQYSHVSVQLPRTYARQ
jgi:hypothetical protein